MARTQPGPKAAISAPPSAAPPMVAPFIAIRNRANARAACSPVTLDISMPSAAGLKKACPVPHSAVSTIMCHSSAAPDSTRAAKAACDTQFRALAATMTRCRGSRSATAPDEEEEDQGQEPGGGHEADVPGVATGLQHREGRRDEGSVRAEVGDDRGGGQQQVVALGGGLSHMRTIACAGARRQTDCPSDGEPRPVPSAPAFGRRPPGPSERAAYCFGCSSARRTVLRIFWIVASGSSSLTPVGP